MQLEYKINYMDTETTGLKPPPNGDIVQIAITQLRVSYNIDGELENILISEKQYREYANPGHPIEIEAMATHHITEEMVKDATPAHEIKAIAASHACDYWAAHNIDFDRKFFNPPESQWLCTLKLARQVWPQFRSHKLQTLRYQLGLDPLIKDHAAYSLPAHDAGFDTLCGAALLAKILKTSGQHITELLGTSSGANVSPRFPFGKHQGQLWKDVPTSYLKWVIQNSRDEGVVAQSRAEIKSRTKPAGLIKL